MKIKYLGPSTSVNVHPYGAHAQDQTREYPADFAEELLATSKRNQFEAVEDAPEPKTQNPKPKTRK